MPERKSISKSVRFEVFKRDSFTCQYCGRKSPDTILHIDHINPVSKGGDNEIINLITSCQDCNLGKSDRVLTDKASIEKQRAQLEELSERREQLEMMLQWRDELSNFDEEIIDVLVERLEAYMPGNSINDHGRSTIKKWIKKFDVSEILDAAQIASSKVEESASSFFSAIPKICQMKRLPEADQRIRYARGILRNRLSYLNENMALSLMTEAVYLGVDVEWLVEFSKTVRTWSAFRQELESITNG